MTDRPFKHESGLYLVAFLLALAVRLVHLGEMPLADVEAGPALQALSLARGEAAALSPHPLYILATSVLFFLYGGGTNFLARLIPALFGSFLVFIPFLMKNRLHPRPGLILAFFMALDPGLTALSRQAASPIPAITLFLLALAYMDMKKMGRSGFFSALFLLGGPSIWHGLLGLGISWAIARGFTSPPRTSAGFDSSNLDLNESKEPVVEKQAIRFDSSFLIPMAASLVAFGTLFFTVPNGLSAALASLPSYIKSWLTTSDVSAAHTFFALLIYQPLAFLLACFAIIRGWIHGGRRIKILGIWFVVSLLLVIFLPSRQMADLAWTLLPLLTLASTELVRNIHIDPEERGEIAGVAILTAFILVFVWLNLSSLVWFPSETSEYLVRFWLLIGSLVLLMVSLLLIAVGWSVRTARIGGIWGIALVLGAFGLGGTLGSAGLRGLNAPEFWWPPSLPAQASLLQASVRELSEYGTGTHTAAPVVIVGLDSPSLEWVLRDHSVQVRDSFDPNSSPYFIVTPFEMDPALLSAYRGQDFSWGLTPLWNTTLTADWIRWITLREMPQSGDTIILWARDDLFLDHQLIEP